MSRKPRSDCWAKTLRLNNPWDLKMRLVLINFKLKGLSDSVLTEEAPVGFQAPKKLLLRSVRPGWLQKSNRKSWMTTSCDRIPCFISFERYFSLSLSLSLSLSHSLIHTHSPTHSCLIRCFFFKSWIWAAALRGGLTRLLLRCDAGSASIKVSTSFESFAAATRSPGDCCLFRS